MTSVMAFSSLSVLLLTVLKYEVLGFTAVSLHGKMLIKNVVLEKPKMDWLKCLESCSKDVRCFAYSFGPVGKDVGNCVMSLCEARSQSCKLETVEVKGNIAQIVRPAKVSNIRSRFIFLLR